jgi:hypothetical protein
MTTRSFDNIPQFVAFLAGVSASMPVARRKALEIGCQIIETEAKRVLGTYDYHWPELADSTKADRVHQGYPANEPGLRSGEMRDSIEHVVRDIGFLETEGQVGSNEDKAVFFELGTSRQPARSFLVGAAMKKSDAVEAAIGRTIGITFDSGGMSSSGVPFNPIGFTVR